MGSYLMIIMQKYKTKLQFTLINTGLGIRHSKVVKFSNV